MKARRTILGVLVFAVMALVIVIPDLIQAQTPSPAATPQPSVSLAPGTRLPTEATADLLDWWTMDMNSTGDWPDRRYWSLYHDDDPDLIHSYGVLPGVFYIVKASTGRAWDVYRYDAKNIYVVSTDSSDWTGQDYNLHNSGWVLLPRTVTLGFPGTVQRTNTSFTNYIDDGGPVRSSLGHGQYEVWGISTDRDFGGDVGIQDYIVVAFRYGCDADYDICSDKEEWYLTKKYGEVQWCDYDWDDDEYILNKCVSFTKKRNSVVQPIFGGIP